MNFLSSTSQSEQSWNLECWQSLDLSYLSLLSETALKPITNQDRYLTFSSFFKDLNPTDDPWIRHQALEDFTPQVLNLWNTHDLNWDSVSFNQTQEFKRHFDPLLLRFKQTLKRFGIYTSPWLVGGSLRDLSFQKENLVKDWDILWTTSCTSGWHLQFNHHFQQGLEALSLSESEQIRIIEELDNIHATFKRQSQAHPSRSLELEELLYRNHLIHYCIQICFNHFWPYEVQSFLKSDFLSPLKPRLSDSNLTSIPSAQSRSSEYGPELSAVFKLSNGDFQMDMMISIIPPAAPDYLLEPLTSLNLDSSLPSRISWYRIQESFVRPWVQHFDLEICKFWHPLEHIDETPLPIQWHYVQDLPTVWIDYVRQELTVDCTSILSNQWDRVAKRIHRIQQKYPWPLTIIDPEGTHQALLESEFLSICSSDLPNNPSSNSSIKRL